MALRINLKIPLKMLLVFRERTKSTISPTVFFYFCSYILVMILPVRQRKTALKASPKSGTTWRRFARRRLIDHSGHSRLRSPDLYQLHVPRIRTNPGDRSFSVSAPAVWNSLPVELRTPGNSLDAFKLRRQLRTFLFKTADSAFAV